MSYLRRNSIALDQYAAQTAYATPGGSPAAGAIQNGVFFADTSGGVVGVTVPNLVASYAGQRTTLKIRPALGGAALSLICDGTDTINAIAAPYVVGAIATNARTFLPDLTTNDWLLAAREA